MAVPLAHLLKWQFAPLLADPVWVRKVWQHALIQADRETGMATCSRTTAPGRYQT